MENDGIVTGIAKFPERGTYSWLGVLWFMAICASDPDAMKRLTEAHPETLDFIKRGEDGRILVDVLESERYFKEHMNEIFEQQQKANFMKCCTPFMPDSKEDVEPVKHGRWVKMTGMMPPEFHGHYACSECGWSGKNFLNELQFRRCPKCGAKMDGEADDV